MKIHVAGMSHTGNVRTSNEDHFSIGPVVGQKTSLEMRVDTDKPEFTTKGVLAAVADGMGGYAGGELASRLMLETLTRTFYRNPLPKLNRQSAVEYMHVCLRDACTAVSQRLMRSQELIEGGTTIAGVALLPPDIAVVFHAGDSRVLRVSGRFLRALTIDHSPIGADAAAGNVEDESAVERDMRRLTRSIGAEGTNDPEVNGEHFWAPGDRFIICSDGLHGVGKSLTAHELRTAAQEDIGAPDLVLRLIDDALAKGGEDNITAVVIHIQ